jgi:alpha-tubulin suppressor-like RCC1 family protein
LVNGNVGIGTSSPGAQVGITQPSAATKGLLIQGYANNTQPVVQIIAGGSPNTDLFSVVNNAGTSKVSINYNGRVGLGTTVAANLLDINGAASIGYVNTSAPSSGLLVSGNVGIGTSSPAAALDVNGGVKVGNDAGSCTSSNNGEIKYVIGGAPPYKYCNGSAWIPFETASGFVPAYSVLTASSIASGGQNNVLALKATGALWAWGYNGNFQLGTGNNTTQVSPVQVSANYAGPWSSVSASPVHSCGIKSADASAWCWGNNSTGQIGNGSTTNQNNTPSQIAGAWLQLSAGGAGAANYTVSIAAAYLTCGVKSDNTGWCWGGNANGQLGNGTTTQSLTPVQVPGSWLGIWVGRGFHACGLQTDNSLWCWGYNGYGQLGNGNTTDQYSPIQIAGTWKSISVGDISNCAIASDNTLWCWGNNNNSQLGDNTTTQRTSPVQVSGGGSWSQVDVAADSAATVTFGINMSGALYCWGYNIYGQCPTGSNSTASVKVPTAAVTSTVTTGSAWTSVVGVGVNFVCGIRDDSTVYCWGGIPYGTLGSPLWNSYYSPVGGN